MVNGTISDRYNNILYLNIYDKAFNEMRVTYIKKAMEVVANNCTIEFDCVKHIKDIFLDNVVAIVSLAYRFTLHDDRSILQIADIENAISLKRLNLKKYDLIPDTTKKFYDKKGNNVYDEEKNVHKFYDKNGKLQGVISNNTNLNNDIKEYENEIKQEYMSILVYLDNIRSGIRKAMEFAINRDVSDNVVEYMQNVCRDILIDVVKSALKYSNGYKLTMDDIQRAEKNGDYDYKTGTCIVTGM